MKHGTDMHFETVRTVDELKEVVSRIGKCSFLEIENGSSKENLWFRGANDGSFSLIPSLYRYRYPLQKEELLFKLYTESNDGHYSEPLVTWEFVIRMQHYNIPTRLLDWTTDLWVAVFFAMLGKTEQPCIYILDPMKLNRKSKINRLDIVPSGNKLNFKDYFYMCPEPSFDSPLGIIPQPKKANQRLKTQCGRFTVQGRNPRPLDEQAPECLVKITLDETFSTEFKDELVSKNYCAYTIFPDHEGKAQFVNTEAFLELIPYDDNVAEKIRERLRERAMRDLEILTERKRGGEPSSMGISYCNLDEVYLERESEASKMDEWLKSGPPFLFVTGKAGVGKTNFILHTLLLRDKFKSFPFVFFSFKIFGMNQIQGDTENRKTELLNYLFDIMLPPKPTEKEQDVALKMILEGDVILALDGLDELARIRNVREEKDVEKVVNIVESLGNDLETLFGGSSKARVIISCRDHIFAQLRGIGVLGSKLTQENLPLKPFESTFVRKELEKQKIEVPPRLAKLAAVPLFYEMIRRSRSHLPELLDAQDAQTKLEKVWFDIILNENGYPDLDLSKLGDIAGKMLLARSDLIKKSSITCELQALMKDLSRYPFALFMEELEGVFSFSHQSLREFVLAWCVAEEIKKHSFNLLKSNSSFDYEGHEFYDRVKDLLDIKKTVIGNFRNLMDLRDLNEEERNHVIRNIFEMIGELAPEDNQLTQIVAKRALPFLSPSRKGKKYVSFKTRYNIVRCLERIHWSAPRPYIRHISSFSWWRSPKGKPKAGQQYLYAYAIRGFNKPKQEATAKPPIVYIESKKKSPMPQLEKQVSDRLLSTILNLKEHEIPEDGLFLGINITSALIRWLPKKPDLTKIENLLCWRHIDWRMKQNIFYALYVRYGTKIPKIFTKEGYFRDAGHLVGAPKKVLNTFNRLKHK